MNLPKQHQKTAIFVAIASTLLLTSGSVLSKQPKTHLSPKSTLATTQATSTNLPRQALPVPGWLGFATVDANSKHQFPWSPVHQKGQVIIFSDAWAKVKPGTRLVAVSKGIKSDTIKQNVTFLRSSQEPYGCDGIPTTMASFSSQSPFPEGLVWVLPPSSATNAKFVPFIEQSLAQVPTNILSANQRQPNRARAWKAGSATIVLQKQDKYQVKMTMALNNRVVYTQQAKKYGFGDEENLEPVTLSQPEPGIPQAIAAFQLKMGQPPVIVMWIPGYEGNSFDILVPQGNSVKRFETGGIYFCAY